ncbi:MAG TPA: lysylphosphatidylglycerol synthase domain-containing protein [Rhizomicrobium sp.]
MKRISIALAIAGLMLGTLMVAWFGFGPIAKALLSVGARGFALYCAWQIATMIVLGVGWRAVAPLKHGLRLAPFVWGRMVRDSAAACLPFSMVGGFVFGVRAAALLGVAWTLAALSTVIDLTAEFLAEIAFAVAGFAELLVRAGNRSLTGPFVGGLIAMLIAGAAVLRWWKGAPALFARLSRRMLGARLQHYLKLESVSEGDLVRMYGDSGRMALGTAIHFAGWLCKGAGNWIAFRLLGYHVDMMVALAIEALLHALLIPALVVPGYAGVQEAGYAAIGALFGIPPEISLAVSLLRRARDIAIGIPILLLWQGAEVRRLHSDPPGTPGNAGRDDAG